MPSHVVATLAGRPPNGLHPDDARLPILVMAKKAARGHGVFIQETHLRDADLQDKRYKVVVESGDKAKAEGISPMWKYVNAQLRKAGLTDAEGLSQSRIGHLRTEPAPPC